jgi:hypothetical protein
MTRKTRGRPLHPSSAQNRHRCLLSATGDILNHLVAAAKPLEIGHHARSRRAISCSATWRSMTANERLLRS